jgi:diguanylate cyclase (GGDEF)-like protein
LWRDNTLAVSSPIARHAIDANTDAATLKRTFEEASSMDISEISSRKLFKAIAFAAGLLLSTSTFYFDLTVVPNEITLLLPYILVIYFSTLLIGNRSGIFFSVLAVAFWFLSNSKMLSDLSIVVFLNLAIKTTFVFLIFSLVRYNRKLYEQVKNLSLLDELTGLNNRRGFFTLAHYEISRLERSGESFSLLYIDIDNFKEVNDNRGHKEGDKVLREMGKIIRKTTRGIDIPSRICGDEFCIFLPNVGKAEIKEIALRVKEDFARSTETNSWRTTLSIGSYTCSEEYDLEVIIKKGDALMYRAKRSGKDRIQYGSS